jgi:hypothetical protein
LLAWSQLKPPRDDCFAQTDVAELTIAVATDRA